MRRGAKRCVSDGWRRDRQKSMLAGMAGIVQQAVSPEMQIMLGLASIMSVTERSVFTEASVSDTKGNDPPWDQYRDNKKLLGKHNHWHRHMVAV